MPMLTKQLLVMLLNIPDLTTYLNKKMPRFLQGICKITTIVYSFMNEQPSVSFPLINCILYIPGVNWATGI